MLATHGLDLALIRFLLCMCVYVYKVVDMFLAGFREPSQVVDHSLGAFCLVHVQFTKGR